MPADHATSPLSPSPPQGIIRQHGRAALRLLLAVLVPLLLFADLAEDIFRHGGFAWDQSLLDWYAARRTPGLTQAARVLAVVAGAGGLPLLTLLFAWALRRRRGDVHAAFLVLAVAGATCSTCWRNSSFTGPGPTNCSRCSANRAFPFPAVTRW